MKKKWTYPKSYIFYHSRPRYRGAYSDGAEKTSSLNLSGGDSEQPARVKYDLLLTKNPFKTGNGVYVHIPFCASRCSYCQWAATTYDKPRLARYLDAVVQEIGMIRDTPYVTSTTFESLYIGGGTPSILASAEIGRLLGTIRSSFSFHEDVEATFECNPASLNAEKLRGLADGGVTRVSLGVQTFDDDLLRSMNCGHDSRSARRAIDATLNAGLLLNVDLLFGLTGQTSARWEMDLREVCSFGPGQITAYALRLFPGSALHKKLVVDGDYTMEQHETLLAEMDSIGYESLSSSGYVRSDFPFNYAKQGVPHLRYLPIEVRSVNIGAAAGGLFDNGESINEGDIDHYIALIEKKQLPIRAELALSQRLVHERFVFFRLVYGNKSAAGFRERVAKRFREYFDCEMNESLYDEVVAEMKKYDLLETRDGVMQNTARLWGYVDNSIMLY